MHVAHDRFRDDYLFSVKPAGNPQRSVRRGVLRSNIQCHISGIKLDVYPSISGLSSHVSHLFAIGGSCHTSPPSASKAAMTSASS